MKKGNKVLLYSILSAIVLISIFIILNSKPVHAVDENIPGMPFGITPETIDKAPQNPTEAKNITVAWIKKNWAENLRNENSFLGKFMAPILKGYDKISPYTNPVFKVILGIEPQLSWVFFLTLVIWIMLVTNLYSILSIFSAFSKVTSFIISLGSIILVSAAGLPRLIAQKIIDLIVKFATTWWMQLIAIVIVIAIFMLLTTFRKEWETFKQKFFEQKEKEKLKEGVEEAKTKSNQAYKTTKAISEAFEDGAGI